MKDQLDQAIDTVAARMTTVEENDAFTSQMINALPQRSTWSLQWLMPRLAVLAMILTAGVMWSSRKTPVELTPLASVTSPVMTGLHASIEAEPNSTMPLERLEPVEPLEPGPDHAFALPSLDAVASLTIDSLIPASVPEDERLIVTPLVIADLPATSDFPR